MPKGGKIVTIYDCNDSCYSCDICGKEFIGTQDSIKMRVNMHNKKVHAGVSIEMPDFYGAGIEITRGNIDSKISKNKTDFATYLYMDSLEVLSKKKKN